MPASPTFLGFLAASVSTSAPVEASWHLSARWPAASPSCQVDLRQLPHDRPPVASVVLAVELIRPADGAVFVAERAEGMFNLEPGIPRGGVGAMVVAPWLLLVRGRTNGGAHQTAYDLHRQAVRNHRALLLGSYLESFVFDLLDHTRENFQLRSAVNAERNIWHRVTDHALDVPVRDRRPHVFEALDHGVAE
jgi:hypothetical protein